MKHLALGVVLALLVFGSVAWADEGVARVLTITPTEGRHGDSVAISCLYVREPLTVDFAGALAPVMAVSSRVGGKEGESVVLTFVPRGALTGPVHVATVETRLDAGCFTLIPDPGGGEGGGDKDRNSPGALLVPARISPPYSAPSPPPVPSSIPSIDRDLDLPIEKPEFRPVSKAPVYPLSPGVKPEKAPEPPKAPLESVDPPPSIYGRELATEGASVFYVLDVSGSMGWDMGQYTDLDGRTTTGNRLDRAKTELVRSIRSLPRNFRFGVVTYDCTVRDLWHGLESADDYHKRAAEDWLRWQEPGGGTGTGPACAVVLGYQNRLVVLLTDGAPNCGAGDESGSDDCLKCHLGMIREANRQGATIHVFGIGATGEFRQFCMDVASSNGGSYQDVR